MMAAYEVYLFLHIASAFVLVAAAAVNMTLTVMLRKSKNNQAIMMLLGLRGRTMLSGLIGAIGASVFGSILAEEAGYGNAAWIVASHITWFVMLLFFIVAFFAGRSARKTVKAELDAGRMESEAAIAAVSKPLLMLPIIGVHVAILIFIYLMTFKPGS